MKTTLLPLRRIIRRLAVYLATTTNRWLVTEDDLRGKTSMQLASLADEVLKNYGDDPMALGLLQVAKAQARFEHLESAFALALREAASPAPTADLQFPTITDPFTVH